MREILIIGRLGANELWGEYITRLEMVNDETVSRLEHLMRVERLQSWLAGVSQASGITFNGDLHYAQSSDPKKRAIWESRPLCCGVILDWGINSEVEELVVNNEIGKFNRDDFGKMTNNES
jgi:hypothetical protein